MIPPDISHPQIINRHPNNPNSDLEFSMNAKAKPQKKKMIFKRPKIKEFDDYSEIAFSILISPLLIILRGLIKIIEFIIDIMVGFFLKNFVKIFRDFLHSMMNKVIKTKNRKLYF